MLSQIVDYNKSLISLRKKQPVLSRGHYPNMEVNLSGMCATNGRHNTVSIDRNTEFELVGFGQLEDSKEVGAAFLVYSHNACTIVPMGLQTARSILGSSFDEVMEFIKEGVGAIEGKGFGEYQSHGDWS